MNEDNYSKRKIGILGGTFNPIHNGHLALAKRAYEELKLDKVLILPSGNSYMKQDVLPKEKRVEMVKIAIEDYPYFELSLIEVHRTGNTYTFETLQKLKEISPFDEYYFILGADSLFNIDSWKHPEIIFELAILVCAVRDEYDLEDIKAQRFLLEQKGAKIELLSMPKINISSSTIRQLVSENKSVSDFVPQAVAKYISEEHFYEN